MCPSEAEITLSFIARRQGQRSLPPSVWAHVASLELGWMTPGEAKRYVDAARSVGLLIEEGDLLHLTVDPRTAPVPRGFRPDPHRTPEPPTPAAANTATAPARTRPVDPFVNWVDRVAQATNRQRAAVLTEVAERQTAMGGLLAAEVAVLWLARDAGLDVSVALQDALERLTVRPST